MTVASFCRPGCSVMDKRILLAGWLLVFVYVSAGSPVVVGKLQAVVQSGARVLPLSSFSVARSRVEVAASRVAVPAATVMRSVIYSYYNSFLSYIYNYIYNIIYI